MSSTPRLLFPNLPPELRNEVFRYLSVPDTLPKATINGLPLKLKTYECKHTTVEICPVHYGSTSLLALQSYRFLEAREYRSWLLDNEIELKIGVTFKGRVNTFVQKDWDAKMETHLRKLAKMHPWLKKVAKFDVRVLWSPADGVMKGKRMAGQIPSGILATLMGLVGPEVKRKKGELRVQLCLEHAVAVETVISGTRFGFAGFMTAATETFKKETIEVWKEAHVKQRGVEPGVRFLPLMTSHQEKRGVLNVEKGLVEWTIGLQGNSVMRKDLLDGVVASVAIGNAQEKDGAVDHIVCTLLGECLGQR
jgi:hypothetical protein